MAATATAVLADAPSQVAASRPDAEDTADGGITIDLRGSSAALCRWSIPNFSKLKQRTVWSRFFDVGGYDCRLLVYPSGDSQALPGYISIYLQISDPRGGSGGKWDCFASYRLAVVNQVDETKSLPRDSWHRFSAKKKSHGWCDFIPSTAVLEPKQGFIVNDVVIVTAEILILQESVSFSREIDHLGSSSAPGGAPASTTGTVINGAVSVSGEVYSGKFTWRVHNFSLFRETIKTQKIMSPLFPAGECSLRLSVYQSPVAGVEHLSMCLESKDTDKGPSPLSLMAGTSTISERSCWCLFRMSVTSQVPGGKSIHRDSYGRFAADARSGDNTSLGWNDYMPLASFMDEAAGYIVDDTAVFSTTFHIIRESCSFNRLLDKSARALGRPSKGKPALGSSEPFQGKFTWRIDNFTRLKDLLKKRKITGLCIKSKRFQVGGRDCRLIVYPRGQSQPPNHLSMFLEVTDSRTVAGDWSCFVSHRLAVVNQRVDDRSVSKESQNRYSKAAKDWGWREFVTLTSLFDLDAGFLVNDTVVFSAEVLVLKESTEVREVGADGPLPLALPEGTTTGPPKNTPPRPPLLPPPGGAPSSTAVEPFKRVQFTWRIENFPAFRDILETRKIFSRYFAAGGVDLRIGVYESFDTLCIYLESADSVAAASTSKDNAAMGGTASSTEATDRNFWVKYRIAVLNQKHPESTEWKESAICTKTWNNSVLQFIKVSAMVDHDAGYLIKDSLVLACEVLDCCPWCEFGELDVYATDDGASLSTEAEDEEDDDDDSDIDVLQMYEDGEIVRTLLRKAGLSSTELQTPVINLGEVTALQEALRDKLVTNPGAAGAFLMGLRFVLTDIIKAKQLLAPLPCLVNGEPSSASLLSVLGGIQALQPAVVDMALDFMVAHCKVHRHQCGASGRRAEGGEGTTSPTTPAASSPQRAQKGASGLSGSSQPSSRSSTPIVDGPPATDGPRDPPLDPAPRPGTPQPEEVPSGPWSPTRPTASSAASEGDGSECSTASTADVASAAAAAWQQEAVEVLTQMVRWLRSLDVASSMPRADLGGSHALPTVQKVAALLTDAPLSLQADVILLVPTLVAVSEHTAVAGALLGRLAEASREGAAVEAALRLPVLAALGKLAIDPAVAEKVLRAAVEALPYLSDTELPPAVGLVLKLSSSSSSCRAAAVKAVRQRVRQAPAGEGVSQGTVDALRLAVMQHHAVASAMLHEMDAECRSAKSPAAAPASDMEMLLDVLGGGDVGLVDEASRVAERLVVKGALTVANLEATILRRRAQAKLGTDDAHGLAAPLLQSNDHSAVMRLTAQLGQSTHAKAVAFAAPLYGMLFRLGDGAARETTLHAVIQHAFQGCMGPSQPSKPSTAASSKKGGSKKDVHANANANATHSSNNVAQAAVVAREYADLATALVQEHTALGPVALRAALDAAQRCGQQALDAERQLRDADAARTAALAELQQRLTQSEADRDAARAQCRRLTADADARAAEFRAELATQATARRELQERLGQLEGQAEWTRGEHQEAAAAWAREKRELCQKVKDAELMLSRLKTQKRDEGKRAIKERSSLAEKMSAVEAQAAAALQEADAAREALRAAHAEREAANARADQAEATAAAAKAHAAQLQALAAQQADKVLQLQSMSLSSPRGDALASLGPSLVGMSPRELDATAAELERVLVQARGLQGQRARSEDFAAPHQGLSSAASMPPGAPLGALGLSTPGNPLGGGESMGSMSSLSRLEPGSAALGAGSLGGFGGLFYGSGGGAFVTHPAGKQGQPALGGVMGGLGGLGSMQGYGNGLLGGGLLQQQHQHQQSGGHSTGSAGNTSPAPSGSGQQLW